jgi:hypothetical protein
MPARAEHRILFACVAEGNPKWLASVERLAFSLREFGGSCREAPFIVSFVGEVPEGGTEVLAKLGTQTRVVEPVDESRTAAANKLRMLDLHSSFDFDILVALDCDTVVVGDPADYLSTSAIGAKPADSNPFTRGDWRRLYRALGIDQNLLKFPARSTGQVIPPYFNSGVLGVPSSLCAELYDEWAKAHSELTEALGANSKVIPRHRHFLTEQLAFGLCVVRSQLPLRPFPVAMNYPTHIRAFGPADPSGSPPVILHYHDAIDHQGFLRQPQTAAAFDAADKFNNARANRLRLPYSAMPERSKSSRSGDGVVERLLLLLTVRQRLRAWFSRSAPPNRAQRRGEAQRGIR